MGKTYSAQPGLGPGNKRKQKKELGQAHIESRTQTRKGGPAAFSPNLDFKKRRNCPETTALPTSKSCNLTKLHPRQTLPLLRVQRSLQRSLESKRSNRKRDSNPLAIGQRIIPGLGALQSTIQRLLQTPIRKDRTLYSSRSGKDMREREREKAPELCSEPQGWRIPEQYTAAYEQHILTKGLNMDLLIGEELVSEESKELCSDLQQITQETIAPTVSPAEAIRNFINYCLNRNEAIVNRDVTSMIIPSITSLYCGGDKCLEHLIDEINADWYEKCILEGPRIRPDLAIGLFSSAFTEEEVEKLKRYISVDNWTQITMHMFFPFLMGEVKCSRESLNKADRQNMHSCSVAVTALLRIQQEADKYRPEKKIDSLNNQVLVFSISHGQQDARLHGHYAIIEGDKWTSYRYRIRKFDLIDNNSLLAIHNLVRNILKSYLPKHLRRLKDSVAALPGPNKPAERVACLGGVGCPTQHRYH